MNIKKSYNYLLYIEEIVKTAGLFPTSEVKLMDGTYLDKSSDLRKNLLDAIKYIKAILETLISIK